MISKKKKQKRFEWPRYHEAQIKSFLLDNAAAVFELYMRVDEVEMTPKIKKHANILRTDIKILWFTLLNQINDAEYHRHYEGGYLVFDELVTNQRALTRKIKRLAHIVSAHGSVAVAKLFGLPWPIMRRQCDKKAHQ